MSLIKKKLHVVVTFTEEVLGMSPNSQNIYREFIASKSPDAATIEDEVAAVGPDEVAEKQMTIFPKLEDGKPFVYDYQIKGMFKDSCGMLSRLSTKETEEGKKITKKVPQNESGKLTAFKKIIDGLVFVKPRKIPLLWDGDLGICERPLRASTPQGERVALASSETAPSGTVMEFDVCLLDPKLEGAVREWLDYGMLRGFGQWRNSGKGTFKYEITEVAEPA